MTDISEAELDRATKQEAAEYWEHIIAQMQAQIDALYTAVTAQNDRITRIDAATRMHACPGGAVVPTPHIYQGHPANIGECMSAGLCNCEIGYILTAETWSPPKAEGSSF